MTPSYDKSPYIIKNQSENTKTIQKFQKQNNYGPIYDGQLE